jgi:proliferating cell nuclear antigen
MDLEQTYVLRLQTVQSTVIKTLCDVLKETLNDINFIFDETGMRVMAMDGSHVALVHLKLMSKNFEQYYCQKRVQVGLNMSHLFKIIKTVTTMDYITFFIKTDNQHEFGIQIENADKNTCTTFHLKMLDIDEEEISIPDIAIESMITMPSNDFQRMTRDMLNISDHLIMTSSSDMLRLECRGDFASQETCIGNSNHGLSCSQNEEVTGTFSLKYINLFTKATNLSNIVEIYLKRDYPLMLKYAVANLGQIMFYLAPTAEDN